MISFEALTPYEKEQMRAIEAWKNEVPGVVSSTMNLIFSPATLLVQKVIPGSAIQKILESSNRVAAGLSNSGDVLKGTGVETVSELRETNLELCDGLALGVYKWAIGMAIAEGGATGVTGLPGLIADIPAIITLALSTAQKTGLCYGYEFKDEMDKQFVLGVLSASGANSKKEKDEALKAIQSFEKTLVETDDPGLSKSNERQRFFKESQLVAGNLAKQLSINLSKRKTLQTIPIIGMGVGASANAWYIKDVGKAARRIFQQRWLVERQNREKNG